MKDIVASENFTAKNRVYFFDMAKAQNGSLFIDLVCSQRQENGSYERAKLRFWEEQFEFMIEALHSLFSHADHVIGKREPQVGDAGAKGIKSWAPSERPREKLLLEGRTALADAELLAILIGSGLPGVTAVDLAVRILHSVNDDLGKLAALMAEDLLAFRGMGHAKSLCIIAAMELGRRVAALGRRQPRLKLAT